MWTTARLDWFLAEDAEDELALEEPLGFDSLRYQCVHRGLIWPCKGGGLFGRSCFHRVESRRTLLSAVYSFLHGPLTYDKRFSYYGTPPESWQSFQDCHGKLWYYNELTREWFYACSPPAPWRRYRFASSSLECMYWWWHASERRWFFEPQKEYAMKALLKRSVKAMKGGAVQGISPWPYGRWELVGGAEPSQTNSGATSAASTPWEDS